MIRAFEHFSAELLLKYQSKYFVEDDLYDNVLHFQALKNKFRQFLKKKLVVNQIKLAIDATMNIKKQNFKKRFVKLNEMRDSAFNKRMKMKKNMTRKTTKRKVSSELKDLIKLRRLNQNNQKFHKLESR